jgi:predicted nucleotide-binding protein
MAYGPEADRPRARQNVVFELGYFFGKLKRGHVAVLNRVRLF